MRKVFHKFADKTSLGGFNKLSSTRRQVTVAWILIILVVSAASIYHLCSLVSTFFEYNVNTVFMIKRDSFKFPDVTFCATAQASTLRFKAEKYKKFVDIHKFGEKFWRHYWYHVNYNNTKRDKVILGDIEDIADKFLFEEFDRTGFETLDRVVNQHERYWFIDFLGPIARQKQDIVIDCNLGNEECSPDDFVLYDDPYHYNCFTFRPRNRSVVDTQTMSGVPKTLKLILHREDGKRLATTAEDYMSHAIGFFVAVHEEKTLPDRGSFILAQTGYKTSIFIDLTVQEKMNLPNRRCKENEGSGGFNFMAIRMRDNQMYTYSNGTYHEDRRACLAYNYQLKMINKCHCFSPTLPIPGKLKDQLNDMYWKKGKRVPTCGYVSVADFNLSSLHTVTATNSPNQTVMVKTKYMKRNSDLIHDFEQYIFSNNIVTELECFHRNNVMDEGIEKMCTESCFQHNYTPLTINRVQYPYTARQAGQFLRSRLKRAIEMSVKGNLDTSVLDELNRTILQNKDNITFYRRVLQHVEIVPVSTDANYLVENRALTIVELLSNVGGMFGLWSGLCVITLFEVLELGILVISTFVRRVHDNDNHVVT